jgi:predicted flap endonuclease-1-like 5' DNA nuclease
MTYSIDPLLIAVAIIALLLGLFAGLAIRAPLKRTVAVLQERGDGLGRERDTAIAERDRLGLELKARDAQIRPLADEVDKLRRDFARARAGVGAPSSNAGAQTAAAPEDVRTVDPLDLKQLKGVGAKFADKFAAVGITRIDQIAGWNPADVVVIDGQMGDFRGRIAGDRLVEQAVLLTNGRYTEYETLFGKLGQA